MNQKIAVSPAQELRRRLRMEWLYQSLFLCRGSRWYFRGEMVKKAVESVVSVRLRHKTDRTAEENRNLVRAYCVRYVLKYEMTKREALNLRKSADAFAERQIRAQLGEC